MPLPASTSSFLSSSLLGLAAENGRDQQHVMTPETVAFFQQSSEALTQQLAAQALAMSVREWNGLGRWDDFIDHHDHDEKVTGGPEDVNHRSTAVLSALYVKRITALLLVRMVAVLAPSHHYDDLSTATICRKTLLAQEAWCPQYITPTVVQQLHTHVTYLMHHYSRKLPFHNAHHAYHVVLSCNKLMDMFLALDADHYNVNVDDEQPHHRPPAHGLRDDPIQLLALIYAALIHDVEHKGVTNRQLVKEGHKLAMMYNDQSVQEQRSLCLAFEDLLSDKYPQLRQVMFGSDPKDARTNYTRFRQLVIGMVLSTDIASPERSQISRSKWKEAFGSDLLAERTREGSGLIVGSPPPGRRSSLASNISMPRAKWMAGASPHHRRGSNASINSMVSDVTADSHMMINNHMMLLSSSQHARSPHPRRSSVETSHSNASDYAHDSVGGGGIMNRRLLPPPPSPLMQRHLSQRSSGVDDSLGSEYAHDSIAMAEPRTAHSILAPMSVDEDAVEYYGLSSSPPNHVRSSSSHQYHQHMGASPSFQNHYRRNSIQSHTSEYTVKSVSADSVGLAQRRLAGQGLTRRRRLDANHNDNIAYTGPPPPEAPEEAPAHRPTYYSDEVEEEDDDSSLSLTPPSSDDELDGVPITGVTLSHSLENQQLQNHQSHTSMSLRSSQSSASQPKIVRSTKSFDMVEQEHPSFLTRRPVSRRASTGNAPSSRFGNLQGQRIDENVANNEPITRFLASSRSFDMGQEDRPVVGDSSRYRKRLGIRRSMDLSGESIEIYSRGGASNVSDLQDESTEAVDPPDDLKASVILELLLRASDVAHFMQDWDTMKLWMSRMFMELAAAHSVGRGHDPRQSWFENQLSMMESYLQPLSRRLDEIGIYGEFLGALFAQNVESNRDRWLVEGFDLTAALQEEAATMALQTRYFV